MNKTVSGKACFIMRIKKVDSKSIKLHETSRVKLKTDGNTREVQFTVENNNHCITVMPQKQAIVSGLL